MCIIKKVFYYEETKLPVIKYKDEIWLRAKTVPNILRYKKNMKLIHNHVDPEDKIILAELGPKSKQNETFPLKTSGTRKTRFISRGVAMGQKCDQHMLPW